MSASNRRFSHLVVIGSSAGGIESLSAVVSALPASFPAPIVIAQHLSPSRPSSLVDILGRRGPLPVRSVSDRDMLEPGVVYVVPPHYDAIIDGTDVVLNDEGQSPQPSIDRLFSSAAESIGEDVIAVVLSGTGSDGAAGARDVKYAGGTVIIQDPETAAYPGMPLSLAPSIVDIVANRDRIGELLNALVTGEFVVPEVSEHSHLQAFLGELREHSGIDFSTYKQPTIERRLQRRMAATGQPSIPEYIRYVHHNPAERQRLVSSFLIKVTEFFRDPELYTYLGQDLLPELIRDARARDAGLRVWSAGCATGEE
ncbi:MAG: PAS domain S-box protein, partial [Chloroflexota bacterium]|nr:PAS domain S-box protein [Chloroflexota bacterium]